MSPVPARAGRRERRVCLALLTILAAAGSGALAAQEEPEETPEARIERLERAVEELEARLAARDTTGLAELRRRFDAVLRELEEMRLGGDIIAAADTTYFGLAPAASKVYRARPGVSIAGYGEILYEKFAPERQNGTPSGRVDRLDVLRAIVYVGYKFTDRILFNSEIEIEHATTGDGVGEVSLEFAYLDYFLSDRLGLRAGLLLPPLGFLNEQHEPLTFLGTTRPATERAIIPSTWREIGLGIFGAVAGWDFRAYVVNGLNGVGEGSPAASGFSASGLRGGRQKGGKTVAEEFAGVVRLDYTGVLGLLVGSSLYYGQSGQNTDSPLRADRTISAPTLIWEAHAQYRARGLDLRGLVALADVGDVEELNAARGLEGDASIGERLWGGYVEVGYDVLRDVATSHQLLPYIRYERLNTQAAVPEGFRVDPANDRAVLSLGAAWRPISQVMLKADYQLHTNGAETGVDRFNVALGWLF